MTPLAVDVHGSRPAQHGATPAYADAVLTSGAPDAYTQRAPHTPSAGVRVETGHVVVARGSEHEAVLSEATLELGQAPLKPGPLRYADPAVERDFWTSFLVVSVLFVSHASAIDMNVEDGSVCREF